MTEYLEKAALVRILRAKAEMGRLSEYSVCFDNVAKMIELLPAADVEEVRCGRWEEVDWVEPDGHGFGTVRTPKAGLRCNQCSNVFKKELLWKRNYCPNCGAKMDLED